VSGVTGGDPPRGWKGAFAGVPALGSSDYPACAAKIAHKRAAGSDPPFEMAGTEAGPTVRKAPSQEGYGRQGARLRRRLGHASLRLTPAFYGHAAINPLAL